jgi:hypothetical protein
MLHRAVFVILLATFGINIAAAQTGRREFLSPDEINSIQDEQDPGKRILLYVQFAARRVEAIREAVTAPDPKTGHDVQQYLAEYNSIWDAIADSLESARVQRSMMEKPMHEVESKGTQFLRYLQALQTGKSANRDDYELTLEEAIDTTKDEIAEVKKGAFPEVNARKPPSDMPSSAPPRSDAGSDKNNSGKNNADKSGSEDGPPRKKPRNSQNQ